MRPEDRPLLREVSLSGEIEALKKRAEVLADALDSLFCAIEPDMLATLRHQGYETIIAAAESALRLEGRRP